MRRPFIAGNWKMYKTNREAEKTVQDLKDKLKEVKSVDVMIAPPYTALSLAAGITDGSNIYLGAQNVHYENEGAYTGEISPPMLVSAGCQYVIIGHSERRQYFGCTDKDVNLRLKSAVTAGLKPVVCIGEKLEERESGKTFEVLSAQLSGSLKNLSEEEKNVLIVAYEPVWAIGTGKTATPDMAEEAHKYIRGKLADMYGRPFASGVRILYGGSVKPDNIKDLMAQDNIDGALVGGASLDADSFSQIVKF